MLILKLAYNEDLNFSYDLQELRDLLKKKDILIGFVESIEGKTHIIKIICEEEYYNEKIKEIINLYVSNILYRIVIDNYRKKEMFEFLTDNYFFLKQNEILEAEDEIMKVLKCEEKTKNEQSAYCLNRINSMIEKIRECISEKQEINIDGFITFRMRKLRGDIEKIIDKVIEIYMVEKEYKEFIKLLKYFVEIQESKIEEINIIIEENNNYIVKNKEGKNLYYDFLKEITAEQGAIELNMEDVLISGLITNAPKNIIIYGKENCTNKEFLDTIKNVFEDKVIFCEYDDKFKPKKIIAKNIDMY
ncbi:YtxC-like family protein [Clostridium puniceum]|uniref:YtxC-like family protein n=1 Tax=Clostridium puniceum TaxID=29367 RepID=A0A1S8TTC6_9CLOT|nr:putative sporulation protein YtxC [Clostridium puniceum]OOM81053.1 YtxC-like family protein [Clostridium puniceum]